MKKEEPIKTEGGVKRDFFGRTKLAVTPGTSAYKPIAAQKLQPVKYKHLEGFTNAIKRKALFKNLL